MIAMNTMPPQISLSEGKFPDAAEATRLQVKVLGTTHRVISHSLPTVQPRVPNPMYWLLLS